MRDVESELVGKSVTDVCLMRYVHPEPVGKYVIEVRPMRDVESVPVGKSVIEVCLMRYAYWDMSNLSSLGCQ